MALPGPNEVVSSLIGAARLLRRDVGGLSNFNMTEEGFWRSFFAMALVLPLVAVAAVTFRENTEVGAAALASRTSVNLVLQWAAYTAVMLLFTRSLDLGHNYMRFITVHNWCTVIATLCMMVPVLLHGLGLLSITAAMFVVFFILLTMLAYFWFVARETLETSGFVAAGVVFIDFLMDLLIERFFGLPHVL